MVFDRRGHLFVACDLTSSVIELDAWGVVQRRYEMARGREFAISSLLATSDGSVWVARHEPDGLHRVDPADGTVVTYPLASGSEPSALVESRGSLYCTNAGLSTIVQIDRQGSLVEPLSVLPRDSEPIALTTDSRGRLYAAH
ncbi:MAG: hypothetical protein JWR01_2477, partial [Subtercola sp.]|nr:hypothetical protein [Subtercola sp.]